MKDLDPFRLSRELGALARRTSSMDREIARGRPTLDPFSGRDWPGKQLFDEIAELDDSDPLRRSLLRWTCHFIDERVQLGWRVQEGRLVHEERHGVREPRDGEFTLAQLGRLALTTSGAERRGFLEARARNERALGAHRVELWARRAEVARRLGLEHPDALLSPLDQPARLDELAWDFLSRTREAAEQIGRAGFAHYVECLLAAPAGESLPARLAPDTLRALLGAELFRGVNVQAFPLPERFAPSSFSLAFVRLGMAWAKALAPAEFPFVVAHEPARLVARREGALFASWWCRHSFLRRRLGVSRERARHEARAWQCSWLLEGRRRAVHVLLRSAALVGRVEVERDAPRLTEELFGEELAGEAAFGRLNFGAAAPADFVRFLGSGRERCGVRPRVRRGLLR